MDGWMIALCVFFGVVLGGTFVAALVVVAMNEFWKELLNR